MVVFAAPQCQRVATPTLRPLDGPERPRPSHSARGETGHLLANHHRLVGQWMVQSGWLADDPALHFGDEHPEVVEQERYHYDMSVWQRRRYRKEYGGPP